MKLNLFETHDRYEHFTKQNFEIADCVQDLINQRPFGSHPFYIFGHPRTDDDGVTKRLIWQPRLTKPTPQTNSMLFKVYPGTDIVKILWMIPDRAMWSQYKRGNVTENKLVVDSIREFQHNREQMAQPEADDLPDDKIDAIYKELAAEARAKKAKAGLITLETSAASQQPSA